MTISHAEMEFDPAFVGGMAWVSFAIGALVSMVTVIMAYTLLALPLWMALLIYPVMGTMVALTVLIILYLRSEYSDGDKPIGRTTKTDCCHSAVAPVGNTSSLITERL